MCKSHQATKQCQPIVEKTEKNVTKEHGFVLAKHENHVSFVMDAKSS